MNALMSKKPLSLVQPYFLCAMSAGASFSLAVGNAAGTAGIVASMAILIMGYAFRRIHNKRAKGQAKKRLEQLKEQAAAKAALQPHSSKSSLMSSVAAVKAQHDEEEAIDLTPVLFKKNQKLKLLERMHAKRDETMLDLLQKMVDNQTKVQQLLYRQHPSGTACVGGCDEQEFNAIEFPSLSFTPFCCTLDHPLSDPYLL